MRLQFMDPGNLRTQLSLQDPTETPDGSGGFVTTWTERALVWAALEPASQRLESWGQRQVSEAAHRITMRFRNDVRSGQRLVSTTKTYRIELATDLDGTGRYLVCQAREEVQ
jgi:SPP1 family predicted phage head-tail adaptor